MLTDVQQHSSEQMLIWIRQNCRKFSLSYEWLRCSTGVTATFTFTNDYGHEGNYQVTSDGLEDCLYQVYRQCGGPALIREL